MITKNSPKVATKFYCERCDYKCSKKSDYNKHLTTAKHKKITNDNKNSPKVATAYSCDICMKTFKYPSGLSRHKQKCENLVQIISENNEKHTEMVHYNPPELSKNDIIELLKQNQTLITSNQEFKELMIDQSKQLQDMQKENQEQQYENQQLQKQLIDVVKHTNNSITNNTINNNQKFNLNFFLNEQCKDAINMSEFIENMELNMEDLTETGRLGYVDGISRILVNKLRELDTYKRPLHCTDVKRETLYIRENDEWSKENDSKKALKGLVDRVSNKNCKNIRQWTEEHPKYQIFDSPENMEYVRLTQAVLGGLGDHECKQFRDKIIKSVIKEVMVNKL